MADFTWGAGGQQVSTGETSSARQKLAMALLQQGTDTSPLPTGTRGAGVWTQGLARVAKALLGGYEADQDEKQQQDGVNLLLSHPLLQGGGGAAPATMAPTVAATPSTADASQPRGIRNNNPLNIEDGSFAQSQPGYAGTDGRFAKFDTPDQGVGAANTLLDGYQKNHGLNTVAGIVNRWAPSSDGNNVSAYATDVAGRLGVDPNAPLTAAQRPALIAAMGQHENGVPIKMPTISPKLQAALSQPVPGQSDNPDPTTAVASTDPAALPAAAQPTQGYAIPGQPAARATSTIAPETQAYIRKLIMNPDTRATGVALLSQYAKPKESYSTATDNNGNIWSINDQTKEQKLLMAAEKDPAAIQEFEYGQTHPEFVQQQLAKTRAGAAQLNNTNNVDTKAPDTYDNQLAGGLAKYHAGLAGGVDEARSRARDIAAMQGAIDAIQANGGSTGGMAPDKTLALQKTINSAASSLGITTPFSEADISDKEFMQKFGRQMAAAQAKNASGARVTNFELGNFLAANPGLQMSTTGNQRLLGIQAQIERRNIGVGSAINDATAQAISAGQRVDPRKIQGIISDYDNANHITDPVTGQDLTQSYTLPEFQTGGTNPAMAARNQVNVGKVRRYNPATGALE